ncbi:MAG TPA: DUF58 domain-containing protein [Candidatus Limnocylindria bacterium]|nr:DUF58 domain-containing protein [Candidatus Limnocylindria bacterium]
MLLLAAIPLGAAAASPAFLVLALLVVLGALVLAAVDWRGSPRLDERDVRRVVAPQLSLGAPNPVAISVRNPFGRPIRLRIRDDVPASFRVDRREAALEVAPGATSSLAYVARPRFRGTFAFGDIHLRAVGPLDLVERQSVARAAAPANVYPDLREIRKYDITTRRGLAYAAGQRRARIPGAGSVFERLREYEPDDDPRSISWTATARRGRPISVEYETERQQRVVIVLDAGRMMASTLGELTKLDHAVNTALMLAYVATAKGDEVGILGYSDEVRSFVPARRGRRQFLRISDALRRLALTTTESDPRTAFELLRTRAARRALVVLFTDLVDTDASRGLVSAVTRLAGNNLVLCCVLADPRLAELARDAPATTAGAYERTVAQTVIEDRARVLAMLRRRGIHTVDVPSDRLTVAVIQRYLELKKRFL